MSKAEERALKTYPIKIAEREGYDENLRERNGYVKGYHQAEKDLTDQARLSSGWDGFYYGQGYKQAEEDLKLTWKDIQLIVSIDWDLEHEGFSCGKSTEEYYKEVLKQFEEERKEK